MVKESNLDKLTFYLEYRDSIINTKEIEVRQSEQRIRFFLALVTGIAAVIGILGNNKSNIINPIDVTLIAIPILIVYGILTFSQVIWSSHVIRNLDVSIVFLNELIKKLDPNLKKGYAKIDLRYESNIIVLRNIKGTFAQYMYLTEGLLVAGFIFLLGLKYYPDRLNTIYYIIVAVAFLITVIIMFAWSHFIKEGTKANKI